MNPATNIEHRTSNAERRTAKPAGAAEDSILLPVLDLEALATVYEAREIDDEALISQLSAIRRLYPQLVYIHALPDHDIYPAAEAGLSARGRSLVNAFMAGQLHAYRQVGELAAAGESEAVLKIGDHLAAEPNPPFTSPNDAD